MGSVFAPAGAAITSGSGQRLRARWPRAKRRRSAFRRRVLFGRQRAPARHDQAPSEWPGCRSHSAQRRAGQVHAGVARAERGEVELVAPEILRLGLVRRTAEKGRELANLADGHVFDHPPAQRRDGFRAHGRLPSEVRLEPHDLRTGRAAAYTTAECLPLLPRERFSPYFIGHLLPTTPAAVSRAFLM